MMKDRQQDILSLICKIDPLSIFDASGDFTSVSYYFSQKYPTIYIPMRKQGCSSSFFHKYVTMSTGSIEVLPPVREEQVLRLPLYKSYVAPMRTFSREEYGLSGDDVVVITAGNRLHYEISNELAEQMCYTLRHNPNIKWLIVGCVDLPYINKIYSDLVSKGVHFIKYESDLPGLYGICDIYLNPDRVGGGTSIAWAMQQGLAVVSSLGASSGTSHIGVEFALEKESDLVPKILEMTKNIDLLNSNKNAMLNIASKWNIDTFIDMLLDGMNRLVSSLI